MAEIAPREETIFALFASTAKFNPHSLFLIIPPALGRDYLPQGQEFTYAEAMENVLFLQRKYKEAGYGPGHRIALLLENRPEFIFHFLALNSLGSSIVPINPDYQGDEILYLLDHSQSDMVVTFNKHLVRLKKLGRTIAILDTESSSQVFPPVKNMPLSSPPDRRAECSVLYTSGTTGRPKGCVLSNNYHLHAGQWYCDLGGLMSLNYGKERFYNPLPLFHMNNLAISLTAVIASGNCLILPERFSPKAWWQDISFSKATAIHYLGIIPPLLLNQPPCYDEKDHCVRFGAGAGIDPKLHDLFEQRFGFPMIEIWGMTETGRIFADNMEPRKKYPRAFGHAPLKELEAKIVDDEDNEVGHGTAGELLVRAKGQDPRAGFFSHYLKDEGATEHAWRGGWFHTGDVVIHQPDGMLVYVDRLKNIIRRSGENIAAAEIESVIQSHPKVAQIVVLAVPDELREEEIMACIVPKEASKPGIELAQEIFQYCIQQLAYFKAPGWILFVDTLPVTSTQKVSKAKIFPSGSDPRQIPEALDLRSQKKRQSP